MLNEIASHQVHNQAMLEAGAVQRLVDCLEKCACNINYSYNECDTWQLINTIAAVCVDEACAMAAVKTGVIPHLLAYLPRGKSPAGDREPDFIDDNVNSSIKSPYKNGLPSQKVI